MPGGAVSSVQVAIHEGRIHRTCEEHEYCPAECASGKIPRDRADREWAESIENAAPTAADPLDDSTYAKARAVRELWKARMARLEYEERIGSLVRADRVRIEQFRWARSIRDALLSVPRRVSGRLASETRPRHIQQLLEDELELALAQVVDPAPPKKKTPPKRPKKGAARARARARA